MPKTLTFSKIEQLGCLLDSSWYLQRYPEVADAKLDALSHFLEHATTGRFDPNPLFDTSWYLQQNAEVAPSGMSAIQHYIAIGAAVGRSPHPLFDSIWYLEQYPDVAGIPLVHFLDFGVAEGRDPHPLFDVSWYRVQCPVPLEKGTNVVEHYLRIGAADGYDPHPLFNTSWYVSQHPEIVPAKINPLVHFLTVGAAAGADPNPNFDTRAYLRQHPGVAKGGANAVLHYLRCGGLPPKDPVRSRIQIFRKGRIGDVLLVTPVLKAMRTKCPEAEIVVSTEHPDLLRHNSSIDHVVESRIPIQGCDETFILDYEMQPDEHIVEAYAQILNVSVEDQTPEICLQHDERIAAGRLLHDAGLRVHERFCVMQLRSGWFVRDWPIDRFKEVAEALEDDGLRVVILGDKPVPPIDFGLDLRGKTSLRMGAAIIEKCSCMLTGDSGLMHVAFALRRPVISLFGCTDPQKRVPDWGLATALQSDIDCRGCHHRQRPLPAIRAPKCQWDTVRCMDELSTDMVLRKARDEINRMDNPLVSIVILHYNKFHLVEACLNSIYRHGARCAFEVIVVANGSPADHIERLQAWRPQLRILRLEQNRGYSEGNNAGAKTARGKYLLLLNDDTTVTPGWLDKLVAFKDADARVGLVGPKLLYPNQEIQHCGTVINERGLGEHLYRHRPGDFAPANRPRYYRAITGACILMEKSLFMLIGGFDPAYGRWGGCEDTDLCFKVMESGKMPAYCPDSVVYHHEGVTRGLHNEKHPEDILARILLRQRWSRYLAPDISDYLLLAAVEAEEGKSWRCLDDVPEEIIERTVTNVIARNMEHENALRVGNLRGMADRGT